MLPFVLNSPWTNAAATSPFRSSRSSFSNCSAFAALSLSIFLAFLLFDRLCFAKEWRRVSECVLPFNDSVEERWSDLVMLGLSPGTTDAKTLVLFLLSSTRAFRRSENDLYHILQLWRRS